MVTAMTSQSGRSRRAISTRSVSLVGVAIAMAATVAPLSGCKKNAADQMPVRLLLVDVDPAARLGNASIDREDLRAQVRTLLANGARVKLAEGTSLGVTLRVRVAPQAQPQPGAFPAPTPSTTASALTMTLEAAVDQSHAGGESYRYKGSSTTGTAGALPATAVLQNLFQGALDQVLLARRARDLDDDTLLSWLAPGATSSADQRRQAVRVLGARKSQAAIPVLIQVLKADDRMLAVHALGALSAAEPKGENRRKVVAAIIEYAEAKATIIRKQAIAAVARVDVPLSRAWLWTMSSGHPDADVRARAEEALTAFDPSIFAETAPKVAEQSVERPAAK